MTIPPLCIIQARLKSTRLPNKMLLTLGGETLIARAYRIACEAFGKANVIVAIPQDDADSPLARELVRIGAVYDSNFAGDERDVLGRFHYIAHCTRWHPDSVIVRYTPDDPFKSVDALRRVAAGSRWPVELGGEAFTLAMLDEAQKREDYGSRSYSPEARCWGGMELTELTPNPRREHITRALFNVAPPVAPEGCWTIDTMADYLEAKRIIEGVSSFDPSTWDAERGATV